MAFNPGKMIRSLLLLGLGAAIGAAGGVTVYKKLHPQAGPRPEGSGPPGSGSMAPPELAPEGGKGQNSAGADVDSTAPPDREPPDLAAGLPAVVPAGPPTVSLAEPLIDMDAGLPEVVVATPEDLDTAVSLDVAADRVTSGPGFFGFPVRSAGEAAAPPADTTLLRLRLMNGRCVGGFDGKSSVLDFSGWTRALTGDLTYEKGRLAETAKGIVTADASTLDTGDADRDKEIRDEHLECAKYPQMKFEISSVKMTGIGTVAMSGAMEIHGIRKDVTIPCSFKLRRDGYAWMKGEITVKMTDFGIKPPVKLGVIKVEDEFRIWFEIWAEPVKEPTR